MKQFSISPVELTTSLLRNRQLIANLVKREVIGRYRGSVLGILWSFFNPLLMLAVYTFVFSVAFKARWPGGSGSKTEFALILFSGLLVFNFFAECVNRAPQLILQNVNYVKKVIFPLEVLPWVVIISALFHLAISFSVWIIFYMVFFGIPHSTAPFFFIVLFPLVMFTLGSSWILASLGVYLRDVSQIIGLCTTALMFLSPIFFPLSALPTDFQNLLKLNPLTLVIEQVRAVLIFGQYPDWQNIGIYTLVSIIVAWIGFGWFQKTRRGFADVL